MSRTSNNRRKKRNRRPDTILRAIPPSPQAQAFAEAFARRLNEGVMAMLGRNPDGTISDSTRAYLRRITRSVTKDPLE